MMICLNSFINYSFPSSQAATGIIYTAPYSTTSPILDGVFNEVIWDDASNVTYSVNNFPNYGIAEGYAVHVADFSIAMLSTQGGLYIGITISMLALNFEGKGFLFPGVFISFDNNNNDEIETNIDDHVIIELNGPESSLRYNGWSNHPMNFVAGSDFIEDTNLYSTNGTVHIEIRNPLLVSNTTTYLVGLDFGLIASPQSGSNIFARTFDSGILLDIAGEPVEDSYANAGGPSFSSLTIQPTVTAPPLVSTTSLTETLNPITNTVTITEIETEHHTEFVTQDPETITEVSENNALPFSIGFFIFAFIPLVSPRLIKRPKK